MLKKYTNGRDLVRLGMTRFATAYLTFACLHEMKASLMRLFSSEEWKKIKFGQEGRKVENLVWNFKRMYSYASKLLPFLW